MKAHFPNTSFGFNFLNWGRDLEAPRCSVCVAAWDSSCGGDFHLLESKRGKTYRLRFVSASGPKCFSRTWRDLQTTDPEAPALGIAHPVILGFS